MLATWWAEWLEWWQALPPDWRFLMAMPVAVALAGAAGEWLRRREGGTRPR